MVLGALDDQERITEIGLEMNKFPVRASLKRTIVESMKYDEDTQVMVAAMAAAVDAGGLPLYGRFASREWRELSNESSSDLLRQLDLFIEVQGMSKYDQQSIGINPKNVGKAQETYEKILHQLGIKHGALQHPNELQREEMVRCIYAGHVEHIFQRVGRNTFRLLEDSEPTVYKLSDRSVVDPRQPRMVVGVPYIVERTRHGKKEAVPIIESVTEVSTIDVLGEAAVNMARWSDEAVVWRGGRAFLKTEQSIRGLKTGLTHETMGEGNDVAKRAREITSYALEHPGPAQMRLRMIKRELEELNRRSRDSVTVMTQDGLLEFMRLAVERVSVLDVHYLDIELDLIMQEHNITRYTYITQEEEARILRDAPDEIEVSGQVFSLFYSNGHARVQNWSAGQIEYLDEDLYLDDGRRVRFAYEKKDLTVTELKARLALA